MRQSIKTTALLCFAAAVSMTVEASPLQALQAGPPQERQAQVQQEPTDSSVLYFTLDEAMSYALEHNWDLQNSSIAVRQAEADRWTAIASMLPQVNGTLDYSNYMGYEMARSPWRCPTSPAGSRSRRSPSRCGSCIFPPW